jgi:hypothetical protein
MMLLLRVVSILAGLANGYLFFLQVQRPAYYPWICVPSLVIYLVSVLVINRGHWKGVEHVRTLIPAAVSIVISGCGLLLTEGVLLQWVIPCFVGLVTYTVLELQFFHAYAPARYPANGISHVNLLLVPCLFWISAYTSVGVTIFVNVSRSIPVLVMSGVGFVLFYATSYAEATMTERWRWTWIGTWVGMQIGILGVVLPLNLYIHGAIAALCGGFALRVRRYSIQPPIVSRTIWTEFVLFFAFLIAICVTTRWY